MEVGKRRVPRLYVERDLGGDKLILDDREAHYLGHVLRLKRGDDLVAFNGRGTERHASVEVLQRRGAELSLRAPLDALPESPLALTLVQALPKGDAMDLIVQKATELGVRAIRPAYSDFSVVKLDAERTARRVEHWRKIAQSACEQCGRHTPPEIAPPELLAACIDSFAAPVRKISLDPDSHRPLAEVGAATLPTALFVGPEGGFSATDWRQLDAAGCERASVGRRVLRAETAALAACALAQALWGDLRPV
jgi:16S rRNA (uracil1498-N3)-methyltransferase